MQWRLSGQIQAFVLSLMVDGQFVEPDADSVSVTLRDNSGEKLSGSLLSAVTGTQVTVVTSANQNQISDGEQFQTRYLRLDYKVNDVPAFVQEPYRIHRFIPHVVDGNSVRDLVGAEFQELPDSAIDVIGAYFSLLTSFGERLSLALTRSDAACLAANRAIALQAAIEVCPSMSARLVKSEKQDTSAFERNQIDFEKMASDLKAKLANTLDQITLAVDGTSASLEAPTFFVVTKQTDHLTGTDG